jgi:probable phosphoglycerate mutase
LRVIVEADGGARGNPGPAGYGAVVREASTGEVLLEVGESIGEATNNVAEYRGLLAGLRAAADLGAVEVEVRMDSKLVIEQMSGRWQIKHPGLRPLAAEAAALVGRFDSVRFQWVPREQNRAADSLANAAMDGKPLPATDLAASMPSATSAPASTQSSAVTEAPAGLRPSWSPPSSELATRLVLVRHGETEFTAERRYSGRGDVELSPRGEEEADAVAMRLATVVGSAPAVVTSPLARCRRTAEAIASRLGGVPIEVEADLIECDFGDWEGLTFADVKKRWPAELAAWLDSPEVAPPGGESFRAVAARVNAAVVKLLATYPGQTVIVVSHVSPIKLILKDALAGSDAFLHRMFLDPAGISLVDMWPDGGVAVRTVNDTSHLT